jgi:CubicO group peptidase (beta-lactamase class C family)
VDEHTLFAIASNTKAFTSAALSILADEGKLKWTIASSTTCRGSACPTVRHARNAHPRPARASQWPDARRGRPAVLAHDDYTTEEVAHRLKDVPLGGSFRGQYAYDNILFGVAELVIEQASGTSYQSSCARASSSRSA